MNRSIVKLLSSVALLLVLGVAISNTQNDSWLTAWFILFSFVGLPILILSWIDLGHSLRAIEDPPLVIKVLAVLFGVPQAIFGLISFGIGVSIVGWVLYNTLIETLPQYSGGFLTFGVATALVLFGIYWIREAFLREEHGQNDDPA